jgi:hypothetical protein
MNVGHSERQRRERKPHLYCPDKRCLWMTGDGRPCPRHGGPSWTREWADLARRISRGEITVEKAHKLEQRKSLTWINGRLVSKDDVTKCLHGISLDDYCDVCREGL